MLLRLKFTRRIVQFLCHKTFLDAPWPGWTVEMQDGSSVNLFQYFNGDNNVEIEHYKVINGGHGWPGVLGNMDINSNFIIWNFVSQFDINGKI